MLGSISSSRCQTTRLRVGRFTDLHGVETVSMRTRLADPGWWSQTGSNRRPPACKAGALPTELWPQPAPPGQVACQPLQSSKGWWAWEDLNFRPHAYQARALTS